MREFVGKRRGQVSDQLLLFFNSTLNQPGSWRQPNCFAVGRYVDHSGCQGEIYVRGVAGGYCNVPAINCRGQEYAADVGSLAQNRVGGTEPAYGG